MKFLFVAISIGHQDHAICSLKIFLWGYAKDSVYADKPTTLGHVKTNIRQDMADIPPNMFQKVIKIYLLRINAYNTF